jgi:hypothetical protein
MINVMVLPDLHLDADVIERRKRLTRDLWAGKPQDHVPICISVENPVEILELWIPLLIVERREAVYPPKPGFRWSPSFHSQCSIQ